MSSSCLQPCTRSTPCSGCQTLCSGELPAGAAWQGAWADRRVGAWWMHPDSCCWIARMRRLHALPCSLHPGTTLLTPGAARHAPCRVEKSLLAQGGQAGSFNVLHLNTGQSWPAHCERWNRRTSGAWQGPACVGAKAAQQLTLGAPADGSARFGVERSGPGPSEPTAAST